MTTFSYTGTFVDWSNETDGLDAIGTTTLTFVVVDSNDSFAYVNGDFSSEADFDAAKFTNPAPYNMLIKGAYASGEQVISGFLEIEWGAGNLTYVMIFVDSAINDHQFYLGGDALPAFTTVAGFEAFNSAIDSVTTISSGPFLFGTDIRYDSLPGVVVSENDTIRGTGEANIFRGGLGRDKIYGEAGGDILFGEAGNDRLWGGGQSDKLFGGKGNDILNGGTGFDILKGGAGNDKMFGGKGRDSLFGNNGNDVLSGGGGDDALKGGSGADKLIGGNGDDWLLGEDGNDKLFGGRNADLLEAGDGDDILQGGKGDDDLSGGDGIDVFLYSGGKNEGEDLLWDFTVGEDIIRIGGKVTFADITFRELTSEISWNSTTLVFGGGNVSLLTEDDFDFV